MSWKSKYQRDYYQRNRERILEDRAQRRKDPTWRNTANAAIRKARIARQQQIDELVTAFKDRPCADCGQELPSVCMDFDHTKGNKLFNISHARREGRTLKEIRDELAKCELVCANCHRIRTFILRRKT